MDAIYYTKTEGFSTWHDISYRVSQTPNKNERIPKIWWEWSKALLVGVIETLYEMACHMENPFVFVQYIASTYEQPYDFMIRF